MLDIDTASITGRRTRNEDAVAAAIFRSTGAPLATAIVCDGVGKWRDSDLTAEAAVQAGIMQSCAMTTVWDGTPLDDADMTAALHAALDSALEGCSGGSGATTFVAIIATPSTVGVIWVGDSKAWLIRDGAARCLTRPHTLKERLLDEGEPLERAAPQHGVLSQALFDGAELTPGCIVLPPRPGDRFLLASDGLDVLDRVTLADSITEPVGRLVTAAVDAGSTDNVTAARLDVAATHPPSAGRWWAMADARHHEESRP